MDRTSFGKHTCTSRAHVRVNRHARAKAMVGLIDKVIARMRNEPLRDWSHIADATLALATKVLAELNA